MKTHKTIRTEKVGALVIRYAPCGASQRSDDAGTTGAEMVKDAPTCYRCASYFAPFAA